jgi:uroporphyrinogen III methyltransferase/synthase
LLRKQQAVTLVTAGCLRPSADDPTMTEPASSRLGMVFLVGAGPGDPGLITVRGAECLSKADLVLHDYLVSPALLEYAPPAAERVSLGQAHCGRQVPQEEIHRRMIEGARAGRIVVRLKSGDPYLFGRGAEEVEALAAADVCYEVIPGVTAASAAASHAGIPITHRDLASAVALVTGHRRGDGAGPELDYQSLARFPGTLIFYMGMSTAPQWSQALLHGGRPADTPVVIVRRASWPDQEVVRCTLATVADVLRERNLRPPAVIVVGEVAALARRAGQEE